MTSIFQYILSANFFFMWIRVATPIIFPALGAVICEKSGVVNLGLEGIMLLSALSGVLGSAWLGSCWGGLVIGIAAAILASTLFAYFHLVLNANNVLCGTAINVLAAGLTVFALEMATGEKGTSASIRSYSFPTISLPAIQKIPIIGNIISGHNFLTYLAFLMVFLVSFLIFKTPLGLRIRAVGENPNAAMSVGISVIRIRFIAIILCSILAGLGGLYLSMGYLSMFTRGMTAGRGFIALAACAMGQASPIGAFLSALLFAFFDSVSNILQILRIPAEFIQMIPYAATILGLTFYSIQNKFQQQRKNSLQINQAKKA